MRFAAPQWLFLLAALPLLLLVVRASDRRAARRLAALFGRRGPEHVEGFNPRLRSWRRFLTFAGLFWLIVALARPQWGASEVTVTEKGTDIVIALDISNSMHAEDVPPSRLERAKGELNRFLERQPRGRIGLVLFAGAAFVQCPLTLDYGTASLFLRMAEPDMISQQGTAIAAALAVSRELLTAAERRGEAFQAILLVTDGEDLEGEWQEEARRCAAAGISVIPVGIGEETGGLIPVRDAQGQPDGFLRDNDGNVVMTRLDLQALEQLASIGGGSSFRVGVDGLAGDRLRGVIAQLGERDLEERRITAYQERFTWPLALALICFWLRLLLRPRRVVPTGTAATPLAPLLVVGLLAAAIPFAVVPAGAAAPWRPAGAEHAERGSAHYRAGEYEEALREFESARALDPDDPRLSLAVGETLHRLERYPDAVTEFRRALRQSTDAQLRAESLYNAGTSLLAAGEAAPASEALRESLRLDPTQEDALFNLEVAQRLLEQPPPEDQPQTEQQDQQNQQNQQDQQQQQQDQQQQEQQQQQQDQRQEEQQQQQDQQPEQQQDGSEQDEQDAAEQPQPEETPAPQEAQTEDADEDVSPEELTREQALRLLQALDHDEEQLKRSVRQRLQESRNKSGKRW